MGLGELGLAAGPVEFIPHSSEQGPLILNSVLAMEKVALSPPALEFACDSTPSVA